MASIEHFARNESGPKSNLSPEQQAALRRVIFKITTDSLAEELKNPDKES